jgi:hypothetical protein
MTTSNSGVDLLSRVVGYEAQSSTAEDDDIIRYKHTTAMICHFKRKHVKSVGRRRACMDE